MSTNGGTKDVEAKILVVDDEESIVQLLCTALKYEGFATASAGSGREALSAAAEFRPDLVLLDVMLPDIDGFEVHRRLSGASAGRLPVVFLTARRDTDDRIRGLTIGADDYVVKPFSPRELVARVRAVLRRTDGGEAAVSDVVRAADLVIDVPRMRATVAGRAVDLTPWELQLLLVLARQPGRVFTRGQLLDALRGDAFESFERAIDAHIKNVRKKIEPDPGRPRYILTVYGVGYRFAEAE